MAKKMLIGVGILIVLWVVHSSIRYPFFIRKHFLDCEEVRYYMTHITHGGDSEGYEYCGGIPNTPEVNDRIERKRQEGWDYYKKYNCYFLICFER